MTTALKDVIGDSPDRFADVVEAELKSLAAGQAELRHRLDALCDLLETGGRLLSLIGEAAMRPPAPAQFAIDMESVSPFVENLYPCEYTATNVPFRWTGPGTTVKLFLYVDRAKPRQMKIRVMGAVSDEARGTLAVRIDGETVEHVAREHALLVPLPPGEPPGGMTELLIEVPATRSPLELHGEGDARPLGIAIAGIEVG